MTTALSPLVLTFRNLPRDGRDDPPGVTVDDEAGPRYVPRIDRGVEETSVRRLSAYAGIGLGGLRHLNTFADGTGAPDNDSGLHGRYGCPDRFPAVEESGGALADALLFTRASAVLRSVARDPDATVEAIAREAGLTERHVRRLVGDLRRAGLLSVGGRSNRRRYTVDLDAPITGTPDGPRVGDLLALLRDG